MHANWRVGSLIASVRVMIRRRYGVPRTTMRKMSAEESPTDLNRVNSFLNLRVADVWACYKQWRDKGAFFLTEPLDNHGREWRCYMRDPDGYLIEVGQYTQLALDHFKTYAS